jgi:RNA polymerase sigma factor (sigma-70 family)
MVYKVMSDAQLMMLVKYEDDKEAYEVLHSRHSGLSLRICRGCVTDPEDQQGLIQVIWLRVWRRRKTFRDDGVFKAWLIVISKSTCLDYKRTEARQIQVITREGPEGESDEEWLDRLSQQEDQPYRLHTLLVEHSEAVQRAWNRLSAVDQKLLRQVYIEELSQKVMAKERGKSIPTFRKRLNKQLDDARERFRLNLLEEGIRVADPQTTVPPAEEETQDKDEDSSDRSKEVEN